MSYISYIWCALFSRSTPSFLFCYRQTLSSTHVGILSSACDVSLYPLSYCHSTRLHITPLNWTLNDYSIPPSSLTTENSTTNIVPLTSLLFISIHVHLFPPFQVPTYCLQPCFCNILRQCISYCAAGPTCISPLPHKLCVSIFNFTSQIAHTLLGWDKLPHAFPRQYSRSLYYNVNITLFNQSSNKMGKYY